MRVAFNGIITANDGNNSVYIEEYDPETDMYYGFAIYYGFNLPGDGLEILALGNEVRIVGSLQYYETGGTWQIADLNYRVMKPDDPGNIQKLSEGNKASYRLTDPNTFLNGTMDAYASIISNNLNVVMKFLASITIVLSLPTLIASIWGMNVPLPFATILMVL